MPYEVRLCKGFFDAEFYVKTYRDVESTSQALSHYLLHGEFEGRKPFKGFHNQDHQGSWASWIKLSSLSQAVLGKRIEVPNEPGFSLGHKDIGSNSKGSSFWRVNSKQIDASLPIIRKYFDPVFYRDTYPDVVGADEELFSHFMLYGYKELRKPNKDFDPEVFASFNKGLNPKKENVFAYFCLGGKSLKNSILTIHNDRSFLDYYLRSSNFFDQLVYSESLSEIGYSGPNKIKHFIDVGSRLGLKSSPHFDVSGIVDPGPERIKEFIVSALAGKKKYASAVQLSNANYQVEHKHNEIVDVIIPVYDGYEETLRMISSVLESVNNSEFNLIVIYDCGPDIEILKLLKRLAVKHPRLIELHIQDENLGFVKTMNNGFFKHSERDVVILNSDTVVSNHWLDRLLWHAAYNHKTATITPYSNNGTICNFPTFSGFAAQSEFLKVGEISDGLKKANAGLSIQIPTGVGFCMYMSRICLDEIGGFDEDSFGLGYGEENDWCRRAEDAGYRNLHAQDLFVYHEGGVSFASQTVDKQKHEMNLLEKHPDYNKRVSDAFAFDWASGYKLRGLMMWLNESGHKKHLNISHGMGGGTDFFIKENLNPDCVNLILTHVRNENVLKIMLGEQLCEIVLSFSELGVFMNEIHFSKVWVHHQLGWPQNKLKQLLSAVDNYEYVIHDMHVLCPRLYGVNFDGLNCGIPEEISICERCTQSSFEELWHSDARVLRMESFAILKGAQVVHCTTDRMRDHILKLGVLENFSVSTLPWEKCDEPIKTNPRKMNNGETRTKINKVMILGTLSKHKGSMLVKKMVEPFKENGISIIHLGHVVGEKLPIQSTGSYTKGNVLDLIKLHEPDVIWIPSIAEETYSFTFSEALNSGVPIVVNNVGVFPERAVKHSHVNVLDLTSSTKEMLRVFNSVI